MVLANLPFGLKRWMIPGRYDPHFLFETWIILDDPHFCEMHMVPIDPFFGLEKQMVLAKNDLCFFI